MTCHTLGITNNVDLSMSEVAIATGGKKFLESEFEGSNTINDAFTEISETNRGRLTGELHDFVQLHNEHKDVYPMLTFGPSMAAIFGTGLQCNTYVNFRHILVNVSSLLLCRHPCSSASSFLLELCIV